MMEIEVLETCAHNYGLQTLRLESSNFNQDVAYNSFTILTSTLQIAKPDKHSLGAQGYPPGYPVARRRRITSPNHNLKVTFSNLCPFQKETATWQTINPKFK
jgi:hypothetical protein